jgi:glycosyltransferase involved in cell wall biosynthesis
VEGPAVRTGRQAATARFDEEIGARRDMNPKISVVLPVHNRADVLGRAIQSVLDQRLKDFELVIVDDGSSDDSVSVAKSFKDERIKVVELGENRGGNVARNAGIRAASAPLIAFLDSDDTYLPEKLERVVAEFDERPHVELLVDSFIKVQPSGARVVRRNPKINDRETFRRALFTRQLWKATPSITARRDAILSVMFDETLRRLQDFDFLIRASETVNCASTDAVLWVKYWDANAISAQDNMIPANVELVRRHPEYLSVREYRPGLAYILRLSLWRRLKTANFAGAARDIGELASAFGSGQAARLLFEAVFPRRFV